MIAPVPSVENVVSTFTIDTKNNFKLHDIASKCGNSEYNPRRFNGLIMRTKNPKCTSMIFRNGKVIMTGLRSETESRLSSRKIIKKINKLGMCRMSIKKEVETCNVLGTVYTRIRLNLESMNMTEDSQYEPDTFPGLVYRMKNPKSTFLVFNNGKVVITGARS